MRKRKIMFTVYVIESLRNGKRYVGFTSKTAERRLAEHNRGCNKWARENRPFKLVYREFFDNEKDARKKERFLKSGQGRKFLNKKIPR
ncbi:MAG: GIY-YIG nuclease family protein [Candidatus Helarchaeota archaeon]